MREKVEEALGKLKPSLGGAEARLIDLNEGVAIVQYYKPLSNPAACHIDRGRMTKDIAFEVIEEMLKREVPEVGKVIIVEAT